MSVVGGNPQTEKSGGRYVTVGRGAAAYRAFVPAPLPPALAYDAELVRALSDADRALGELAGYARAHPPLSEWLANRETVLSARVDGLDIDLVDLYAEMTQTFPLPDLRPRPQLATLQEVSNARRAAQVGSERLAPLPLSLRLIREMHNLLFAGIREQQVTPGEFRRSQNWIGPPGVLLNEATFVPPPPDELWTALDAFEKYLHQDDGNPPLVRLALIYQQFIAIHPFLDGNGRIGRMLIDLLLQNWGLLPKTLLTLSAYFLHHPQEYSRLIFAVDGEDARSDWLRFFLRGVTEESRDALSRAERLRALHHQWIGWANTPRRNRSRATCVDSFFLIPIWEYQRLGSWRGHADRLVADGFLQRLHDPQRGLIVVAHEIFRIMDE